MSEPKKPLDRFQHLERERSGQLEERVAPTAAGRFGAVEQAPAAPAPEALPASVRRFAKADGPDEVLVEQNRDDEQPFVKCAGCGTESGKFAQACPTCGASFDTPEQREFNQRIWAERKAQLQAERDVSHAREQQLLEQARHDADQRHAMGVAIAQEVAEQHRERDLIQTLSTGGRTLGALDSSPLLGLLNRIPEPWNFVTGGLLVMVPLGLIKWAPHASRLWYGGIIALLLVVLLLIPPGFWLRSRGGWDSFDRW